jgi:hypothetical protein
MLNSIEYIHQFSNQTLQRSPEAGAIPPANKGNHRLRGGSCVSFCRAFQAMQKLGGARRMGGGAEDCAFVFFQHFELSAAAHNAKERYQIG